MLESKKIYFDAYCIKTIDEWLYYLRDKGINAIDACVYSINNHLLLITAVDNLKIEEVKSLYKDLGIPEIHPFPYLEDWGLICIEPYYIGITHDKHYFLMERMKYDYMWVTKGKINKEIEVPNDWRDKSPGLECAKRFKTIWPSHSRLYPHIIRIEAKKHLIQDIKAFQEYDRSKQLTRV